MKMAWREAFLGTHLKFLLVLVTILSEMISATAVSAKVVVFAILLFGI